MKNAFVLARKDFSTYFHSWTGNLIFVFFFILTGIFFCFLTLSYSRISLDVARNSYVAVQGLGLTRFVFGSFFLNLGALLIFLVPIFSMHAFADERRSQTLELLYTYPFSDFEIVWGKYLGMVWFFEVLFLPTGVYLLIIQWMGGQLDYGPVIVAYIGFWLLGNAYLSLGLFISSLTESQAVSAIVTFSCLIIFWIFDWVAGIVDGRLAHILLALSPLAHYREFTLGIMDLSNIVYFCFFNLYFLLSKIPT